MTRDGSSVAADVGRAYQDFQVAHLCDWCSNILIDQRVRNGNRKHLHSCVGGWRTFEQFEVGSEASCPICLTVYLAVQRYDFVDRKDAKFKMDLSYDGVGGRPPRILIWEMNAPRPLQWVFELLPLSDKAAGSSHRVEPYGYPRNSADPMVASLVKSWLYDCSRQHKLCRHRCDESYRPPRLIEIAEDHIKVVDSNELEPGVSYATLSHCWGVSPTFLTLTDQNSRRLHDRIHLHELPKTFQDAVLLCERLDLRFLWVDSLCILQKGEGSKEDWLKHVVEMRDVYRNCFVNIAASHATGANEGLYTERNLLNIRPWCVHSSGDGDVPYGDFSLVQRTISEHSWEQDPLNTRGWVLQERLLSPRVVYWTHDQVFWQCSSLQACETYPCGSSFNPITRLRFDIPDTGGVPHRGSSTWESAVQDYSTRRLSYPNIDKFPAIAGVAQAFASLTNDEYIAGFFKKTLPQALLWQHAYPLLKATQPASGKYRCPSWSWAKTDMPVELHAGSLKNSGVARVVDINIDPEDPQNPFGRLKDARLELQGWVVPFHWLAPDPTAVEEQDPSVVPGHWDDSIETKPVRNPSPISTNVIGHELVARVITFDFAAYLYEDEEDSYVMPIETDSGRHEIRGLILRKIVNGGQSVYMRVGKTKLFVARGHPHPTIMEHFKQMPKVNIILV